jgi:hypothetical protein
MTRVDNVNTTDILDAIRLGCRTMSSVFDADDGNVPFFRSTVRPEARLAFSPDCSESHVPGRHLNAMLTAEAVAGVQLDESAVENHARATFMSYGGPVALPLNRDRVGGRLVNFRAHNVREGFHALYALVKYRQSEQARQTAEASIDAIFDLWDPVDGWDEARLSGDYGLSLFSDLTFITGLARAIGPLVKYYRATAYQPALELATVLKDKAVAEFFAAGGGYDRQLFGRHTHSTTCVMSSLAQLADLTGDASLMARVKAFYDNGLWEIRDEIGWSIEGSREEEDSGRGEANNTGDILETALILGQWGHTEYFHDAERILRCHLLPSQLRDVSFIVEPPNPDGVDGRRNVAERLRGGFGFPSPYGHEPLGIMQSSKPRVGFNLDIVGGAVGSLCEAYRDVTRTDEAGHWVNMLFDHETDSVRVESPYTHSALRVTVKRPAPLFVRVPPWVDTDTVTVDGVRGAARVSNGYFFVPQPPVNRPVTFEFPLAESEITLKNFTGDVRVRLRGDEVTAMDNLGADLTFFDPID